MVVDRRDIAPAGDAVLHLAEEGDGGVGREDQETDSRRKLHGQEIVFTPYKWKLLSPHPRKSQSLSLTSFSLISIGIRTLIILVEYTNFLLRLSMRQHGDFAIDTRPAFRVQ